MVQSAAGQTLVVDDRGAFEGVVDMTHLAKAIRRAQYEARLHYEELTLRGAFHHTPRAVRAALVFLASGAFSWERLITHRVSLDELPALFADPPRDLLKAAVYP